MTENLLAAARRYYDAGLNVLPAIKAQKRPVGAWKKWTKERPNFDAVFRPGLVFDAICVVCGATSGGLEIIDFDQGAVRFPEFARIVGERLKNLPIERTQRGGKHVGIRSDAFEGNRKLANNSSGATIETRGEGGICLIAPSDGYVMEGGDWTRVPTLTTDERRFLFDAARSLNEVLLTGTVPKTQKTAPAPQNAASSYLTGETAAEYLKRTNAGKAALVRAGWEYLRDDGDYEQWKRPSQPVADKPGASWSKKDGFFHVFTSSAPPFEPGKTYSHLQVVALLEYGGDVSEASRAVVRRTKRPRSGSVIETFDPYSGLMLIYAE